jgi:hypothetical protein
MAPALVTLFGVADEAGFGPQNLLKGQRACVVHPVPAATAAQPA